MTEAEHPTNGEILTLLLQEDPARAGLPVESDGTGLRTHLASCPDCTLRAGELRATMRSIELAAGELSPTTAGRVLEEARRRSGSPTSASPERRFRDRASELLNSLREVAASLVQPAAVPAPVRGGGEGPRIQLFETEGYSISISVAPGSSVDRMRLIGSVVPKTADHLPEGAGATVFGGTEVFRTGINEHGEFEADGVPRGELHVDLELGKLRIQISPVDAGGAQPGGG